MEGEQCRWIVEPAGKRAVRRLDLCPSQRFDRNPRLACGRLTYFRRTHRPGLNAARLFFYGAGAGIIHNMLKRFDQPDLSRVGDNKALAIAAFGQSVAAYRYMVLAEKAADPRLRAGLEEMAAREDTRRTQLQALTAKLFSTTCFFLDGHDKDMVCVGPRILDARDQAHFDEAMKLLIASEKRIAGFYAHYAAQTRRPEIKDIFTAFADESLQRVNLLRRMGQDIGRQINEPCPLQFLRPTTTHRP